MITQFEGAELRPRSTDVVHLAVRLSLLAILVYWAFVIARPFIPILAWSVILAVALYPPYDWVARMLGGRRGLAAGIVTLTALLVVIGPVTWLGAELVEFSKAVSEQLTDGSLVLPPPPRSIRNWPLIGEPVFEIWSLASSSLIDAVREIAPHLKPVAGPMLALAGSAGTGVIKFFISLVLAGFLFAPAPRIVGATKAFLMQLVPDRSEEFVTLAGATIRSVSQGVLGLSFLQALLAGIAFKMLGIPGSGIIAFLVFLLGMLQIGSALVIVPIAIYAWATKDTTAALLFTVVIVPIGLMDNILKPIVMGRGLKTPTLVILVGVIGGTLAHGIVGLFVGPVVLAVGWELMSAWLASDERTTDLQAADPSKPSVAAGG